MNTTMLIKTDKVLKTKAQKLAKEMGLPLGTLVNNYLKTFVIERQALFTAPMPNKKTIKVIEEARRDIKAGKNLSGPFSTTKEAIDFLKKL
ncbi:MAG: type II toxin-antitoxin system RelB/DinJ family antitoxin [Minisyncoccia bacterium]